MQVGLEGSLAREQIGQVPGCSFEVLSSGSGCRGSALLVIGSGAVVLAEAGFEDELMTGTDGEGAESTATTSCSLSVSESI